MALFTANWTNLQRTQRIFKFLSGKSCYILLSPSDSSGDLHVMSEEPDMVRREVDIFSEERGKERVPDEDLATLEKLEVRRDYFV
jgi:hypothetical protein